MPHPAASPRTLAPALAALAALAACAGGNEIAPCPGVEVGTFRLAGTRTSAACQGGTGPAGGFDGLFAPSIPTFTATIAYGSQGASAALCLPKAEASPYLGTRTPAPGGEAIAVELETSGAVLAACAGTCAVTVHHAVTGLVARDPVSGAVTGFTGELVETAASTPAADCTPCSAPCTASWALTPAP